MIYRQTDLRGWVGTETKKNGAGTGGDGTEILSPCRPLLHRFSVCRYSITTKFADSLLVRLFVITRFMRSGDLLPSDLTLAMLELRTNFELSALFCSSVISRLCWHR